MPKLKTNAPSIDDLADDDIRSVSDEKIREVLYRLAEKLKQILEYQQVAIEDLYDAVTVIEGQL